MNPERMSSLRVLVLVDDGITPTDRSVAHRRWLEIVPALMERSVDLRVATLREENAFHEGLRQIGCRALALRARHKLSLVRPVARLAKHLRADPVDIVHGHEAVPTVVGAVAALLAGRPRRVYHRYHMYSSPRHETISRVASRLSNRTIAVSHAAAAAARATDRAPDSRITVAHNGTQELGRVATETIERLKRELRIPDGSPVVLSVARLRREKGIDVLVAAAEHIRADEDPTVVVVGSGPESRGLTIDASAGRVVFAGHRDDVGPFYAMADVVVIPSRMDALPFSGVEAMSMGVPIVATDVGGLAELVEHGETGLLVPTEDPVALARSVSDLLGSADRRARMGLAARDRYECGFSLAAMAGSWVHVYRELLGA